MAARISKKLISNTHWKVQSTQRNRSKMQINNRDLYAVSGQKKYTLLRDTHNRWKHKDLYRNEEIYFQKYQNMLCRHFFFIFRIKCTKSAFCALKQQYQILCNCFVAQKRYATYMIQY